jgi:hypothetical protein
MSAKEHNRMSLVRPGDYGSLPATRGLATVTRLPQATGRALAVEAEGLVRTFDGKKAVDQGRLVAEGAPRELKRNVGNDVIVARVDGAGAQGRQAVAGLAGVTSVEGHGDELLIAANDGAATIGAVAVALNSVSTVRHLTLRTPTLDDVFLELTGNRIQPEGQEENEPGRQEMKEVRK